MESAVSAIVICMCSFGRKRKRYGRIANVACHVIIIIIFPEYDYYLG